MARDGVRVARIRSCRGRGKTSFSARARSVRVIAVRAAEDRPAVVWVESRIISETSSERSTGRSASLLGPAVCDHPARINPSSVLGVTAERFTRLYISIPFFALDRSGLRVALLGKL